MYYEESSDNPIGDRYTDGVIAVLAWADARRNTGNYRVRGKRVCHDRGGGYC